MILTPDIDARLFLCQSLTMRLIISCLILLCLSAAQAQPIRAAENKRLYLATDWKAQAEHGGFYQAKARGLYKKAGLDVRIIQGGPTANIPQLLATKTVDFAMGSSFAALNIVAAGVPAKAIMAGFQKDLQVLITHPRQDIRSIADMKDKPIMIADNTITTFWVWLKAKFGFTDNQIRKYTFNLAPFLVNPQAIQQGYLSSEPYLIEKESGIKPQVFLLADEGYPSYATIIMAQQDWIDSHPDKVQAFVDASIQGWIEYIYGDPSPGNALILKANPDMTQDVIDHAIRVIRTYGILDSGDAARLGIGAMTQARWERFFKTMSEYGIYDTDLDWRAAFTTDFVNRNNKQ